LTLSRCVLTKEHVFFALKQFCVGIVAREAHDVSAYDDKSDDDKSDDDTNVEGERDKQLGSHSGGDFHLHCYLHTRSKYLISDVRELVEVNLIGGETYKGSIHITTLRSTRNWFKCITKNDFEPTHCGVDTANFSYNYHMHKYVRENTQFDALHPFILAWSILCITSNISFTLTFYCLLNFALNSLHVHKLMSLSIAIGYIV
jgi:hypothetical protein